MVLDDHEIESSRIEEQSGKRSKAKRDAADRQRRQKMIGEILLKAKKLNDARAYEEGLRFGKVSEGSEEWKRAWDYFYDRQS
jgi:hypothetical protein